MDNQLMGSADFKSIFAAIPARATAEALRLALTPIAGSSPGITSYGNYSEITFTPEQEDRVSAWILSQLNKEPGPVRLQLGGIAIKVISRQYWPWALGFAAFGAGVGYMLAKGGKR